MAAPGVYPGPALKYFYSREEQGRRPGHTWDQPSRRAGGLWGLTPPDGHQEEQEELGQRPGRPGTSPQEVTIGLPDEASDKQSRILEIDFHHCTMYTQTT